MNKTVITTDSGCNPRNMDLMIPCLVLDENDNNYYDMVKISDDNIPVITNIEIFDRALTGEKFHTSCTNINDYVTLMEPILKEGKDIIHLSVSSGISAGSMNSSIVARDMLNDEYGEKKVTVIDTLTIAAGGVVMNDYANDLVKDGLSKEEIIKKLEELKTKITAAYYIPKMENLITSGRLPKFASFSDKLSFRFRVEVNEKGKLVPKLPPYRGGVKQQFFKMLKSIVNKDNVDSFNSNYLALLITRLNEIDLDEIKEYLNSLKYFREDLIQELPFYSAISSYGVEDQIGIALIKK